MASPVLKNSSSPSNLSSTVTITIRTGTSLYLSFFCGIFVVELSLLFTPMTIKDHIRDIPDFPSVGRVYRDVSPILHNIVAFEHAIEMLYQKTADLKPDVIVGIESRGFLFAGPLAMKHGVGIATAKKRTTDHPLDVVGIDYSIEMGTDRIEMLTDSVDPGERVLIVDDLVATGTTAKATAQLVEMLGGKVVGFAFLADINLYDGVETLEEIAPVVHIYDC